MGGFFFPSSITDPGMNSAEKPKYRNPESGDAHVSAAVRTRQTRVCGEGGCWWVEKSKSRDSFN